MATKINESVWGSVPATGGAIRVAPNTLGTCYNNGTFDPDNISAMDKSIVPWGVPYCGLGGMSYLKKLRSPIPIEGSTYQKAGILSTFDIEEFVETNNPIALMMTGSINNASNQNWFSHRMSGAVNSSATSFTSNAAYDRDTDIPAGASSQRMWQFKPIVYLDYQKVMVQVQKVILWDKDSGARIATGNLSSYPASGKTWDDYELLGFEYEIYYRNTNNTWVTSGYYTAIPINEKDTSKYVLDKYFGKQIRPQKWTPYTYCAGIKTVFYGSTGSYQISSLAITKEADSETLFSLTNWTSELTSIGNYINGSQTFDNVSYSMEKKCGFVSGGTWFEIVKGSELPGRDNFGQNVQMGVYYKIKDYEPGTSKASAWAKIIAHEIAFLGLPFQIKISGDAGTPASTASIAEDDVFLPIFDIDHMVTTGRYTTDIAVKQTQVNYTWNNIFDSTIPNWDSTYNPPKHKPSGGDMVIGGSQTNYPNGLTGHNNGGVYNGTDGNAMYQGNNVLRGTVENAIALSMSGKIYCIDGQMLSQAINALNNNSLIQAAARSTIQEIYGANVYDGITLCRMYPFNLEGSAYAQVPYVYGVYPLLELENGVPKPGQYYFWICNKYAYQFDMGYVIPPIQQAWEIENIEYSIYLPFAGTYPIDIRSSEIIRVYLNVDVFSGLGEYVVYQGAQLTHSFKVNLGWDIPINLSRGEMLQNLYTTTQNAIAKTIGVGSTALGVATGNPIAGMAGNMVAQGMVNSEHWAVTAPQIGGIAGLFSYPKARLICKIPKMFKDAYGYNELLGANRSTGYVALNSCSGFVKCKNYKCDIIVATSDEKAEIERLMDTGVFV